MKSMLSLLCSLKLLLVLLSGQAMMYCSESPKKWRVDELVDESHAGFFEGGTAWGFKDYTKKPTTFEALKKTIILSAAQKEIDARLPLKTKPKRYCGLDGLLKRARALVYGKPVFTLESIFAELKHPTSGSFENLKEALFQDNEVWYTVDSLTGLSPLGIILTSYPHATQDEKNQYKRIFKYFLPTDEEELCFVGIESPQPFEIKDHDVSDLHEIFVRYASEERWQDILNRLRSCSDTQRRLQAASAELTEKLSHEKNKQKQPIMVPPKKELTRGTNPVFWLISAAALYGIVQYFTQMGSSNKREHAADYGRLFAGGVK